MNQKCGYQKRQTANHKATLRQRTGNFKFQHYLHTTLAAFAIAALSYS